MMTLIRLFPFLIGDYVEDDDDHWECFRLLWAICDMSCSFQVAADDPTKLAWLVQAYLEAFTTLYSPEYKVTPKMHYLIHLPKQMKLYI
jgi:hypothetical protein